MCYLVESSTLNDNDLLDPEKNMLMLGKIRPVVDVAIDISHYSDFYFYWTVWPRLLTCNVNVPFSFYVIPFLIKKCFSNQPYPDQLWIKLIQHVPIETTYLISTYKLQISRGVRWHCQVCKYSKWTCSNVREITSPPRPPRHDWFMDTSFPVKNIPREKQSQSKNNPGKNQSQEKTFPEKTFPEKIIPE